MTIGSVKLARKSHERSSCVDILAPVLLYLVQWSNENNNFYFSGIFVGWTQKLRNTILKKDQEKKELMKSPQSTEWKMP